MAINGIMVIKIIGKFIWIKKILNINSREIDKTYGHYLEVYHELNQENPNSTITNLGRIEDSSLYHIAHNADLAVQTSHKSLINNGPHKI